MRTEINEIKNQKTIEKINKIESWIFEKTNKIWHTSSKTGKTERRYKLPILGMKIEITPQALQTWKGSQGNIYTTNNSTHIHLTT